MNKSDISKFISDILKFVFLVYKLFIFALAPRKQPPDPEVYIVGFAGELILFSAVLSNYCTRGQSLSWEDPQRRKWQPTPVFLSSESHGQRSLAGYTLCCCKESDKLSE